jgi:hypothetical protein
VDEHAKNYSSALTKFKRASRLLDLLQQETTFDAHDQNILRKYLSDFAARIEFIRGALNQSMQSGTAPARAPS